MTAMFTVSTDWYDQFYAGKDYEQETSILLAIIERLRPGAESLLDVACGTGKHLAYLQEHFRSEGVDANPEMLRIAGARLPDARLTCGDMVDFDLGRRFDVVTCLFSSIGYVATTARLDEAVVAMARHLTPGGVLIVEPWVLPEDWIDPGTNTVNQHEHGGRTLVRVIASRRDGRLSDLRIHYVVAEDGEIETGEEHHTLGLFTKDEYLAAALSARLSPEWLDGGLIGRGLVAAVMPE